MRNYLFITLLVIAAACHNKATNNPQPVGGVLNIKITNRMNGQNLTFNKKYTTALGDTITVNDYKYYISNIQLLSNSGNYIVPLSYYLINTSKSIDTITINNIPANSYSQINFSIGIDSAVNSSSQIQTNPVALDPTVNAEMNWGWGPGLGYKFLLIQGNFYNTTATPPIYTPFSYHIADNNNYKKLNFSSTTPNWSAISIQNGKTTELNVNFNLDSLFIGINLDSTNIVTSPQAAGVTIANNYSKMPQLTGIINP